MAKSTGTNSTAQKKTDEKVVKQIDQVRKDLAAVANTLGAVGGEKLRHVKDKANDLLHNARGKGGVINEAQTKFYDMQNKMTKCIHKKPLASVTIAVGVGFILAHLLRR